MPSKTGRRTAASIERATRELWERVLLEWLRQDDRWFTIEPEQITSGAVFRHSDRNDISMIQVCTRSGMGVYGPVQRVFDDVQSSDPLAVSVRSRTSCAWTSIESLGVAWDTESPKQVNLSDDEYSPEAILARLKSEELSAEDQRQLIIEAEVIQFEPQQARELREVLHQYIVRRRTSNDPHDLTAVASAIRKFIAILDRTELGAVCFLLEIGCVVSPEIELEVAKMAVRKLTADPPDHADPEHELADRLMELVRAYTNPRLLAREKYGAVALNGILALVLLGSNHMDEVLVGLKASSASWFRQAVARRARRTMNGIAEQLPQERAAFVVQRLAALVAASQTA